MNLGLKQLLLTFFSGAYLLALPHICNTTHTSTHLTVVCVWSSIWQVTELQVLSAGAKSTIRQLLASTTTPDQARGMHWLQRKSSPSCLGRCWSTLQQKRSRGCVPQSWPLNGCSCITKHPGSRGCFTAGGGTTDGAIYILLGNPTAGDFCSWGLSVMGVILLWVSTAWDFYWLVISIARDS